MHLYISTWGGEIIIGWKWPIGKLLRLYKNSIKRIIINKCTLSTLSTNAISFSPSQWQICTSWHLYSRIPIENSCQRFFFDLFIFRLILFGIATVDLTTSLFQRILIVSHTKGNHKSLISPHSFSSIVLLSTYMVILSLAFSWQCTLHLKIIPIYPPLICPFWYLSKLRKA